MIIDIPNEEKHYISKVIEFARKQKKMTVETLTEGICAKQTYYKIKKESIMESEVYDQLLERLGLFYDYNRTALPSCDRLLECYLALDWNAFYGEIKAIKSQLNNLDVHRYILKTALDMIKKRMRIDEVKEILPLLPKIIREILSYFVLHYLYTDDVYHFYDLEGLSIDTVVTQTEYLHLLIREERYYQAAKLCDTLLNTTEGKLHFSVLMAKLFIVQAIEPDSFVEVCEEIQRDLYYIPNSDSGYEFLYTVGMFYYAKGYYRKAWEYLNQACIHPKYRIPGLLFLYHMETITTFTLYDRYLDETYEQPMDKTFKVLFHYYKLKYENAEYSVLDDYLWKEGRKIIATSYPKEIVIKIIRDELLWISTQTGNKSHYYQFNKKK